MSSIVHLALLLGAENYIFVHSSLEPVRQQLEAQFPKVFYNRFYFCWQTQNIDKGPTLLPEDELICLKVKL